MREVSERSGKYRMALIRSYDLLLVSLQQIVYVYMRHVRESSSMLLVSIRMSNHTSSQNYQEKTHS